MSLNVKNNQRVLFVLNLPAGTALDPKRYPDLQPKPFEATFVELPKGDAPGGLRVIEKNLPAAITWLPGEEKVGLPEMLGTLPEFQRARLARKLIVVQVEDPPPAAEAPNSDASPNGDPE